MENRKKIETSENKCKYLLFRSDSYVYKYTAIGFGSKRPYIAGSFSHIFICAF